MYIEGDVFERAALINWYLASEEGEPPASYEHDVVGWLKEMYFLNEEITGARRNDPENLTTSDKEFWDTLVTSNFWCGQIKSRYFSRLWKELGQTFPAFELINYTEAYKKFWERFEGKVVDSYSQKVGYHSKIQVEERGGTKDLSRILVFDPVEDQLEHFIFEPTNVGASLSKSLSTLSDNTGYHQPELFLFFLTGYPIICPRWSIRRKHNQFQEGLEIETFAKNLSSEDFSRMYKQKTAHREGGKASFLSKKDMKLWYAMRKVQQSRKGDEAFDQELSSNQDKLWEAVLKKSKQTEDLGPDEWGSPVTVKTRWWRMQKRLPGKVGFDRMNRLQFPSLEREG